MTGLDAWSLTAPHPRMRLTGAGKAYVVEGAVLLLATGGAVEELAAWPTARRLHLGTLLTERVPFFGWDARRTERKLRVIDGAATTAALAL